MNKFISILLISLSFFIYNPVNAQSGVWTWVHGDSASNSVGNFGVQGVAAITNQPPALYEPCEWLDNLHNLWVFGGFGNATSSYSDLWKYDIAINQWIWMKGPGVPNSLGNYGVQGVPNAANNPPAKFCAATWTDTNGDLWMYGGYNTSGNHRDDMWKYSISTNEWIWAGGSAVILQAPVHGSQGIPNALNTPGARYETSATWVDANSDLWMFGGKLTSTFQTCNDLWKFDITTNQWTWMRGANYSQVVGTYGTKGVSDPNNNPSSRYAYSRWNDQKGNFWLFGGFGLCADSVVGNLNDLWKYNLASNEWTWMNGDDTVDVIGNYGALGIASATNYPPAKHEHRAAFIDSCGNFWMFGGYSYFLTATSLFQNDLWKYDPANNLWTWVSGDSSANQLSNYGSLGVASPSNKPGARAGSVAWFNGDSTFYLFGGYMVDVGAKAYNDLWRFDFDTSCHVNILPLPVADFYISDSSTCGGDCISFFDLSTGATSWQWIVTGNQTYYSSLQNPVFCISDSGNYSVTLIACNISGCDTITASQLLYVKYSPEINLGNDTLLCNGDSIKLQATGGYDSYLWSNGNTSDNITVSTNGTYSVVATLDGCSGGDTVVVTFQSCVFPVAAISSSDTTFCGIDCIDFFDQSTGAASWQWTFTGSQTTTSTLQNPTNICYNNSGSFDVQLIVCNQFGCDTISIPNFIVSIALPVISLGADTLICINDSLVLDAGAGFSDYLWSTNETTQSIFVSAAGNYSVQVTSGICTAIDTIVISTQSCAFPVAAFSSSDSTFCGSGCVDFSDLSQNNPISWQWTFTGAQTLTSTDQHPVNICYNNSGSFDVQLISCNQFGCDTITIQNFISIDSIPYVSLGPDTVVCTGDSIILDAGSGFSGYVWSTNETTQAITVSSTGNYFVDVLLGNCTGSDSVYVDVHSCIIPYIVLSSSDTDFCEKQCVDFFDLSQNNPTSWQWYFPGATPDTSTAQNPTGICYNALGSYDIKLVACNSFGCDSLTITDFINVFQNPVDSIYASNDTLYSIPAYSYQWYEVTGGLLAGETNQYFIPTLTGSYYCIVTDSIGCVATSNVIAITGIAGIHPPKGGITIVPNPNDGNFELVFSDVNFLSFAGQKAVIKIMDAIGKVVFYSELKSNKVQIHIEEGMYEVELTVNGKVFRQKMVLKK